MNSFNQFINEESDNEQGTNNNPFLRAPFHHSLANKQIPVSSFNPNGIGTGKRTSAFVPYQKQEINSHNHSKFLILHKYFY